MTTVRPFPFHRLLKALGLTTLAACGLTVGPPASIAAGATSADLQYMDVDGARLPYVEQGSGEPVILIHGATGDHRAWDPHRALISSNGYRVISYSMRYFGKESWSDKWPPFSSQLHTSDLASFLRGLNAGPAHLVSWSYSGHIALSVALDHPELVKSVFAFEPGVPSYVSDPAANKTIQESAGVLFGPAVEAVKQGDEAESSRRLIDGVAGRPGFFQQLPKELQGVLLDNARTMPLLFGEPPARPITCAELGVTKPPVAIVWGDRTTPFFREIAEAAAKCIRSAKHIVVPGVGHMWPGEDPTGFSTALVEFLKGKWAAR